MTLHSAIRPADGGSAASDSAAAVTPNVTPLRLAIWAILFQLAWNAKRLPDILREGWMPDADDFMRLHQIRNWLAGHGWFDVSVPRMDPGTGGDLHWSRLVDVPIGFLIRFLELFASPVMAERMAAIVWPTMLLVCLVLIVAAICDRTAPQGNKLLTLLFTVMCVPAMAEFAPGRIDHHSVQIALFSLALLGLVNRDRRWGRYLIGASIASSIAIGIDTFLLLLVLLAFLGLDWALGRDHDGAGLLRTAVAMSGAVIALFLVSVPPSQWLVARPDAISIFFVALLLAVSAGFGLLFLLSRSLPQASGGKNIAIRMSAGAGVAFAAIAILYLLYGDVLTGNLARVSAELQVRLINDIVEVKSLPQIVQIMPEQWFATAGYSAVLIVAGYWALRRSAVPQPQLATIHVMMVLAILASFFQFRLLRTGIVASIPVSVAIVSALADILKQRLEQQKTRLLITVPAATLVFLQPVWLAVGLAFAAAGRTAEAGNSSASASASASMTATDPEEKQALPEWRKGPIYPVCNLQSQYGFLAKLPPGLVLNDLNSGPPILVFTGHPVLAGNYHRNGKAILQTLDFFETSEHKARAIARETGAAYVGFCATGQPIPRGPGHDGKLASRILRGKPPAWLQQISPPGDRFIVLKVLKEK